MEIHDTYIILGSYVFLFLSSTLIVKFVYRTVSDGSISEEVGKSTSDTGFVIGICENFLILTFMLVGEFTALAIIFAAKGIIRIEDNKKNPLYYLACTMVNFTYSLFIGMVMLHALDTW